MNSFSAKISGDGWRLEYKWRDGQSDRFELKLSGDEVIVLNYATLRGILGHEMVAWTRSERFETKVTKTRTGLLFERTWIDGRKQTDSIPFDEWRKILRLAEWLQDQPSVARYMMTPYTNDVEVKNA